MLARLPLAVNKIDGSEPFEAQDVKPGPWTDALHGGYGRWETGSYQVILDGERSCRPIRQAAAGQIRASDSARSRRGSAGFPGLGELRRACDLAGPKTALV